MIPLTLGLALVACSTYCLAGAPHLTRALKRKFPSDGPQEKVRANSRHKLKATVGIFTGLSLGLAPLVLVLLDLLSARSREALGEVFLGLMFFAPAFSIWGAAHLAWHRGASPMLPVIAGGFGFVIMWLMAALQNMPLVLMGYTFVTIAPVLVVFFLKAGTRQKRF